MAQDAVSGLAQAWRAAGFTGPQRAAAQRQQADAQTALARARAQYQLLTPQQTARPATAVRPVSQSQPLPDAQEMAAMAISAQQHAATNYGSPDGTAGRYVPGPDNQPVWQTERQPDLYVNMKHSQGETVGKDSPYWNLYPATQEERDYAAILPADAEKRAAAQAQYERDAQLARDAAAGNRVLVPQTHELTQAEFEALSPRQQAAVLFNTGAVNAYNDDRTHGRQGDAATSLQGFLTELNLDESLGLSGVATDEILGLLENPKAKQDMASSLRYARGDRRAAGDAQFLNDALSASSKAADRLSAALVSGQRSLGQTAPSTEPGFGSGAADSIVQYAFNGLADASQNVSLQQVADYLQQANATSGTNVTLNDVFNFANLRLKAADYAQLNPNESFMLALDPTVTSKTPEQLRAELGL